jgi:hypothetical protein
MLTSAAGSHAPGVHLQTALRHTPRVIAVFIHKPSFFLFRIWNKKRTIASDSSPRTAVCRHRRLGSHAAVDRERRAGEHLRPIRIR